MIRLALTLLGGLVLGAIVHLVSVLALPQIASNDAYARLATITPVNTITALPLARQANTALLPQLDPAFAMAVCRYDLTSGPIKLTVPVSQAYTSVSFYTDEVLAYYAINDRSAGRRVIELDLMSDAQRADMPEEEDVTSADRLIIESPSKRGLILVKALAPEPGLMPQVQRALAAAKCVVQPQPAADKTKR